MSRQRHTLSTIGLPVRKELLVRSMLRVVNDRMPSQWSYADGLNVDVVICGSSTVPEVSALKRSRVSGSPRCVDLIDGVAGIVNDTRTLHDPIRLPDMVALLGALSNELALQERSTTPRPDVVSLPPAPARAFHFGVALHALIMRASRDVLRVEIGGVVLHVIPAARALLVINTIDDETLARILEAPGEARVTTVPEAHAQGLIADGAKPQSIDWLLWRAGLHGPQDRLLPTLPTDARFALRRWPDFGRLKHEQHHMQMAARLTRAPLSIAELSAAVGQSESRARAFVNACSLCDLIEVHGANVRQAQPLRAPPAQSAVPASRGYAGIFRSIRSALGLGVS